MAEMRLNTTTSITDFLKSQGKPSDFGSRESLYKSSGLEERLGKYVGSVSQNTAFLKNLSTPTSTGALTQEQLDAQNAERGITQVNRDPAKVGVSIANESLSETGVDTNQTGNIGSSGITASQALSSIPGVPSTDEILGQVFNSPGFQNYMTGTQAQDAYDIGSASAEKQKLEGEAASNTRKFIDTMGRRGLFFSGETESGLQSLVESLATSKLGVDRKLANELIQSDVKTRNTIMNMVEGIVKDAQNGRKEAVSALEKVGLTIVGNQVLPTLAAQSAERAERNAVLAQEREARLTATTEFNQQATLARLELSEEAAKRAATSLQLSIDRAAGGGIVTSGSLSISRDQIGTAASTLNAARGADGWTDPYLYLQAYQQWTGQGGLPQDFTKTFPPSAYVNPAATNVTKDGSPLLPKFLQNNPSNNIITISPASIQASLEGGE